MYAFYFVFAVTLPIT